MKIYGLESGFSLVELMVATALGLFLLGGVASVYVSNKKTYEFEQGLARLQENGRIAIQRLNKDIRMVGYIGCARITEVKPANLSAPVDFNLATSLVGFHNRLSTSPYQPTALLPILQASLSGSDVLLIQEADPNTVEASTNSSQAITVGNAIFKKGNVLLFSDCDHAAIFSVKEVNKRSVISKVPIPDEYQLQNAQVSRLLTLVYYVADTRRKNQVGDPIYALYCRDLNNASTKPAELVEGVENMQIYYGVTIPGLQTLSYLAANEVPDWAQVRNVKIELSLNSIEAVTDQSQPYFNGQKIDKDHRLHRKWMTIIALRERS